MFWLRFKELYEISFGDYFFPYMRTTLVNTDTEWMRVMHNFRLGFKEIEEEEEDR